MKKSCLRTNLRQATSGAHDRLDSAMRHVSGWSTAEEYSRFLALQYAARLPVERWIAANAPIDLRAPAQSHLIARDLAALDAPVPPVRAAFTCSTGPFREASALGAAWVLAGSSLGNRSILKEMGRSGHSDWPSAFLADPGMLAFWKHLRPRIDEPASADVLSAATASATAVFDHFIAHTSHSCPAAAA